MAGKVLKCHSKSSSHTYTKSCDEQFVISKYFQFYNVVSKKSCFLFSSPYVGQHPPFQHHLESNAFQTLVLVRVTRGILLKCTSRFCFSGHQLSNRLLGQCCSEDLTLSNNGIEGQEQGRAHPLSSEHLY